MPHAFSRRSGHAGDERSNGLFHMLTDPLGTFFFIRTADLTTHDNRIGVRVIVEQLHHIQVLQAVDRVSANTYTT